MTIPPLEIAFRVDCTPQRAFALWTAKTSLWWPKSHTVSGEPDLDVVIEPHVGGRIYERTPSGDEHDWGRVRDWDPPGAFGYAWHLRQDPASATDVRITFTPNATGGTDITIVHRDWASPDQRERNERGWGGLLPHFLTATGAAS